MTIKFLFLLGLLGFIITFLLGYLVLYVKDVIEEAKRIVNQEYWWCDFCNEEIGGSRVTFEENHDFCGQPVRLVSHIELADLIRP